MTADLEAVVVAAYVFADEYPGPLHGAAPRSTVGCRCSTVSRIPNLARRRVAVHAPLRPASDVRPVSAGDEDLRRGFLDPRPHRLPAPLGLLAAALRRSAAPGRALPSLPGRGSPRRAPRGGCRDRCVAGRRGASSWRACVGRAHRASSDASASPRPTLDGPGLSGASYMWATWWTCSHRR